MKVYFYENGRLEKATGDSIFKQSNKTNILQVKLPMISSANSDTAVVTCMFKLPITNNKESDQYGQYSSQSLLLKRNVDTEDGGFLWEGYVGEGYLNNYGTAYFSIRIAVENGTIIKTTEYVEFIIEESGDYIASSILPELAEQIMQRLIDTEGDILQLQIDTNNLMENKQDKFDEELNTTDKSVVGAINDLDERTLDLSVNKQNKTDYDLKTDAKTIVGAINELNTAVDATSQPANTENFGFVKYATDEEATEGILEDKVINPKQLKSFVEEKGGKINTISVNGVKQPITNKNVNITVPSVEGLASESYVDIKISDLVNTAPETLDTLGEIATALEENQDAVDILNSAIGTKANQSDLNTTNTNVTNLTTRVTNIETKNTQQDTAIGNKVDKVEGKGLSTNDYTTTEKTKLAGIEEGANNYVLPSDVVQDANYVHTDNNFTTDEKNKIPVIESNVGSLSRTAVRKTGDETISGKKTFSNGSGYIRVGENDTIDGTVVPVVKLAVTRDLGEGYRTQKFQDKDGSIALLEDIPEKLPNPNALTIKKDGEVIYTYDGTSTAEIDMPSDTGGTKIPLYETTGQSSFGAMTQKAVTDELQNFKVINVTLSTSTSTFAYYNIDKTYEELTINGAEFVIRFNSTPNYSSSVGLIDKNGGIHHIYQQSYFQGVGYASNYIDLSSETFKTGDLVRIKYATGLKSNTNSTVNGFVAIENISNSYFYGTSQGVIADTTLSLSSGNAVQNRVVTNELNKKSNSDASNLSETDVKNWKEKLNVTLPIGFVIYSSCKQNNAGLHLADGSELAIGGTYDAFCQYVINNQADFPITDLATYQTELNTIGQCGKYVITDTYVKLPKITKQLESANTESELGQSMGAGLPNITGKVNGWQKDGSSSTGALFTSSKISTLPGSASSSGYKEINFDASKSNSIYGNSDTVQPQTTKYYCYIVVGTVTKTDIVVNIDNIATDVNNKADKSGANISSTEAFNWAGLLAGETTGWLPQIKQISNVGSYSGYVQYGNVLMQWGLKGAIGGSKVSETVTLYKPYASASSYSVVSYANSGPENDYMNAQRITGLTATSFKIQSYFSETGKYAFWFAIGFAPEE